MKFTDLFIRRPVLAIVVSLVIIIAGVQAISTLNVRQYPKSENSSITVTTVYIGASPELVRGFVTTPLEQAIAAADGIDYLQSQSAQGLSTITARLKLNYDGDRALAEISSKVDAVRNLLPPEAQIPAISIQSADSQFAAAYLSFTSDVLKQNEITEYLVRAVQPRLAALEGVQRADILGARTFAMRIWLKADRLAAFNISPAQVNAALAANNHLTALGTTKGSLIQVNLTADTDLRSVDEFKRLVIRQQSGAIVRLEDVADVELGAEDYDTAVRFSGQTAVFMGIFPLPNANSLDVLKRVRTEMAGIQADLPSGMQARIAYDATGYINTAIHEVINTLVVTLLIVVVVIFLFLGSFRSVVVPVVAIPISLIGGVFLMQVFGFTINLLTLLAIVLSVGLVVDDAIVVVENVERHLSEGRTPLNAALLGARELVGPIIAMTITLAAVYAPIGLQGGLTGSLFREFAFTLAGAVLISGVVALTLSPMMSAKLLKAGDDEKGFAGVVTHAFARLRNSYGRGLGWSLANRGIIYTVWIVIGVVGVLMISQAPKELAPTEDQGVIFGAAITSANSTLDQVTPFAEAVNKAFFTIPETEFVFQLIQPSGGFGGVVFKPWDQRKRNASQILPEVQMKLQKIPGIQMFAGQPSSLPGGDQFPFEVVISSTRDFDQILPLAQQIQGDAAKSGMFAFPPIIDVKIDQPQSEVIIDRDKVAALGINLQEVGTDLAAAMGGNYVNFFDIAGRSYKVIPQVKRVDRLNPDQLKEIYVTGPQGALIPLSTIATIKNTTVARSLNRFQQLNAVALTGVAFVPLDQALRFVENDAAKILPKGFVVDYMGESRQLRRSGGDGEFWAMMGLAITLIFLVLAAQFNSFRDPLVIIGGSVPLAIFGSAIFMFLKMPNPNIPYWTNGWTTTLNIYSKVGLVTLIGLIAKNGILIVEFANKLQLAEKTKLEAVHEASLTRLRPILMTSVATVAGHFPLTLVTGAGAAARNSIGLTLVGGMSIGTFFTLFIVPSVYVLIAKDHAKDRVKDSARETEGEVAAEELEAFPRMKRKRFLFIAAAFVAMGGAVMAIGPATPPPVFPDRLDLKAAIGFALENSFAIREARERIRQQQGVVVEVRGKEIPNVAAQGLYQENTASISQTYPPSTTFWQVSVTATQTLFAGGGVRSAINGAKLTRDAAVLDLQSTVNQALLDVRTKFYNVLLTQEKIRVQEENVQLLKSQLKDASDRFEAGTTSSFDQLRADVALANGQVPLITARNDFRIAVEQLRQALGLTARSSGDALKTPQFVGTLDYARTTFDLEACLEAARANRPELLRLAKLKDAGEQSVTTARSNYYPNVALAGGWEAEKAPFVFGPGSSSVNGWHVGLQSQWNIFDGASTSGRVAEARSLFEQSKLSLDEQSLSIDVEVRQSYSAWEEADELAAATHKTVGQAEESLRQATARYEAGSATHLDVLQAQVDLTQARVNLVQANYSYAVALAQLREATGMADEYIVN